MICRDSVVELRGGALRIAEDLEEHEEFLAANVIHKIGKIDYVDCGWVEIECEDGSSVGVSLDTVLLLESGRLEAGSIHPGHTLFGFKTVQETRHHDAGLLLALRGTVDLPLKVNGIWIVG